MTGPVVVVGGGPAAVISTGTQGPAGPAGPAGAAGPQGPPGPAPLNSPAFTGTPTAPTPLTADDTTTLATTAFVKNVLAAGYVDTSTDQTVGGNKTFQDPVGLDEGLSYHITPLFDNNLSLGVGTPFVVIESLTAARTCPLASVNTGQQFNIIVLDPKGLVSGTNTISFSPQGEPSGDTINGTSAITLAMSAPGQVAILQGDGAGHWSLSILSGPGATIAWSLITGTPTTLGGYGITDAYTKTAADARYAPVAGPFPWADVSGTPTTLAGYSISDAYTKTAADARYAPIAGPFPWADITGEPTTVAGYGITNALVTTNNLSDVNNAATARGNLAAAPLASPTFTGTPAAPTAAAGTQTTQLATTAFCGQTNTSVQTISGTLTLTATQATGVFYYLTASGGNQTVKLPTHVAGQNVCIMNVGASNNVLVDDSTSTLLITLAPGMSAFLNDDGTVWRIH